MKHDIVHNHYLFKSQYDWVTELKMVPRVLCRSLRDAQAFAQQHSHTAYVIRDIGGAVVRTGSLPELARWTALQTSVFYMEPSVLCDDYETVEGFRFAFTPHSNALVRRVLRVEPCSTTTTPYCTTSQPVSLSESSHVSLVYRVIQQFVHMNRTALPTCGYIDVCSVDLSTHYVTDIQSDTHPNQVSSVSEADE